MIYKKWTATRILFKLFVRMNLNSEENFFFVSYAKAGRTWVRQLLNHYFFYKYPFQITEKTKFRYFEHIPEITFSHGGHDFGRLEDIQKFMNGVKFKNIIFLIRDPRDVFVSYYFQRTRRNIPRGYKRIDWSRIKIEELLYDERYGFKRIIEHTNLWYSSLEKFDKRHVLHYEKLRNDSIEEFSKLLVFLTSDEVNYTALEKAIEETKFESMKEKEKSKLHNISSLNRSGEDENDFKVRRGKVGGFKDYFQMKEIEYMNEAMNLLNDEIKKFYQPF